MRRHHYKSKPSNITKISIAIGIALILFLFIWKMPVKQTEITTEIKTPIPAVNTD